VTSLFSSFIEGFFLSLGLIIAIGAQNAFVLRQGILKKHTFLIAFVSSLSDAFLIILGCVGAGTVVSRYPSLLTFILWGGVIFLLVFGMRSFYRAFWKPVLFGSSDASKDVTRKGSISSAVAFSLLNPHAYLDTVVIIGSVSAAYLGVRKLSFGAGATTASFVWFFALAYGARLLIPLFRKPAAGRILDRKQVERLRRVVVLKPEKEDEKVPKGARKVDEFVYLAEYLPDPKPPERKDRKGGKGRRSKGKGKGKGKGKKRWSKPREEKGPRRTSPSVTKKGIAPSTSRA